MPDLKQTVKKAAGIASLMVGVGGLGAGLTIAGPQMLKEVFPTAAEKEANADETGADNLRVALALGSVAAIYLGGKALLGDKPEETVETITAMESPQPAEPAEGGQLAEVIPISINQPPDEPKIRISS